MRSTETSSEGASAWEKCESRTKWLRDKRFAENQRTGEFTAQCGQQQIAGVSAQASTTIDLGESKLPPTQTPTKSPVHPGGGGRKIKASRKPY